MRRALLVLFVLLGFVVGADKAADSSEEKPIASKRLLEKRTIALTAPLIKTQNPFFFSEASVELELGMTGVRIHYTLDGGLPHETSPLYTKPLVVTSSCRLQAIAFHDDWLESDLAALDLLHLKHRIPKAHLSSPPHPRYAAKGATSLVDGEKGTMNLRDGKWLGFREEVEIELDLERAVPLSRAALCCLEDQGSWIFLPRRIAVSTSLKGGGFSQVCSREYDPPQRGDQPRSRVLTLRFPPHRARFVRLKIEGQGEYPTWHPGRDSSEPPWFFLDEANVE